MDNETENLKHKLEAAQKAGCYKGKHYSIYPQEVNGLIQHNKLNKAEELLLHLVDATEAQNELDDGGVAPWYYEKLAILYHEQNNLQKEINILERFAKQRHAPGVIPARLAERLTHLKILNL